MFVEFAYIVPTLHEQMKKLEKYKYMLIFSVGSGNKDK